MRGKYTSLRFDTGAVTQERIKLWGCNSILVECRIVDPGVAGSSPVIPVLF